MPQLIFSPSARQDLVGIFDFIARDKPVAASNWIDLIEEKCDLIASTPTLGEQRTEFGVDVRSSMVGRYVIFYRPIDLGIEVVRVISGERDIRSL
jgi:toxin ParE1/3/4